MDKDTEKATITISTETADWLRVRYPDALSMQEAVRMAISDARSQDERAPPGSIETDTD